MRLVGLATLVLALAAGACGGAGDSELSQQEYERELQALPGLFDDAACELPDGIEALEARQAGHRRIVEELEGLEPPDEVADAHAKLVSAHRTSADALDGALAAVRALPDPGEAPSRDEQADRLGEQFAVAAREQPDVPELAEAQRELGEAGYTVDPPALEPDAYEERANEILAEVAPIAIPDAEDTGALQAEADRIGVALVEAAERLDGLVPPRPVGEAHEHLVAGLCNRGQELVAFARFGGVDPDDPADTESARMVVATIDGNLEEAAEDFEERGYEIAVPEVETGP